MPVQVSVVVVADSERPPQEVIASVDAQTLPAEQFELVLLDLGLDEAAQRSMERLAARRPNVKLLRPDADWLGALVGEYVLQVGLDQRLFPEAAERLLAYAGQHDLDVVAGRSASAGQAVPGVLLADATGLDGEARELALTAPVRLLRREVVEAVGPLLRLTALEPRVGVCAQYPAAAGIGPATSSGLAVHANHPALNWSGDELVVEVSGTVQGEAGDHLVAALLLRRLDSGLSYLLPTQGGVSPLTEGPVAESRWRVSAGVSPLRAAAGQPLPTGRYQIDVAIGGAAQGAPSVPLPGGVVPPGFFDDVVVIVPDRPDDTLHLDVGGAHYPLVTDAPASAATIIESAAGSLLRLRLPGHVQTTGTIAGHIALNRFVLPATIETSSGEAVLTAYLSGLAGDYPLFTQFGGLALRPTGLTVKVLGGGEMLVVETPAPPPAPPPAPAAAPAPPPPPAKPPRPAAAAAAAKKKRKKRRKKRQRARPVAKGPVARIRRAVPPAWEPQLRQLRKRPWARAVYRRVTGLATPGRAGSGSP